MRAAFLAAALLGGCATAPALPPVPAALTHCPCAPSVPAPPPRVRTPERIARFAVALELAREAERARGDACAETLEALNDWLQAQENAYNSRK